MRLPVSTAVLLCVIGIAAKAQVAAPAPIPVGTVKAERKQISKTPDFVGRVEAINRVGLQLLFGAQFPLAYLVRINATIEHLLDLYQ